MINSALSPEIDVSAAHVLSVNTSPKRLYQGITPGEESFVLTPPEAQDLLKRDPASRSVVHPYLTGRDLTSAPGGQPTRSIIDLNAYDLIEVQRFRGAYQHVEQRVLPVRESRAKREAESNAAALAANPKATVNRHHEMFLMGK